MAQADEDKKKAREYLNQIEDEKKIITQKREKLEETIRKGTKQLINDSVEEANELIDEIKAILKKQELEMSDLFHAQKIRKQLENMSADYSSETVVAELKDETPPKAGDEVYVISLAKKGVLLSLNAKGDGEVKMGKLTVRVKKGDFYKIKK